MTIARIDVQNTSKVEPSVTAVSVAMAYMRALDTQYGYLTTPQELNLVKHLVNIAQQSLSGFNYALCTGVSYLPYSMQQSFFKYVVFSYYDEIIMLRKLMIKEKIQQAINSNGLEQIVFLGGGYDVRSTMTALSHPDVHVFELDRGPTRENKLKALKSIPAEINLGAITLNELPDGTLQMNHNLHLIACDLSTDNLLEKLQSNGYDAAKKTLVIAEGLTPYLSEAANQQLLTSLASLLKEETDELLLSYVSNKSCTTIANASLQSSKETYQFSLPIPDALRFANRLGYNVAAHFEASMQLPQLGLATIQPPMREHYYALRKATVVNEKTINEIPRINLTLPPTAIRQAPTCTIL